MDMFRFYLQNILRPVFEDPNLIQEESSDDEQDGEDENVLGQSSSTLVAKDLRSRNLKRKSRRGNRPEDILDLQGPKLIEGCRVWILFYQLVGQLNWLGVPFYLSIIYKIAVLGLMLYVFYERFIKGLMNTSILDLPYRNPIFIFISFLAILSTAFNSILAFYTNLFNLCPLFKVLTTPRLCFITEEIQSIIGNRTTTTILVFLTYHSCLMVLLVHTDLAEFVQNFHIGRFLIFLFCCICLIYHLIGLSHLDFYIRACFASWLIALKSNLEYRFAHLHRHQRLNRLRHNQRAARPMAAGSTDQERAAEQNREDSQFNDASCERTPETRPIDSIEDELQRSRITLNEFKVKYKIVTLDEIQKNLNTMDDHLEVWRSIQTSSLVLITLNAFLTNGALLLLAYNLLANRGNYYHGLLLILLVTNYTIIIFFCYIGDSWLYYALSSFVQTVEDEYFLQGGDEGDMTGIGAGTGTNDRDTPNGAVSEPLDLAREHQLFFIKKKDVLFCREFLHQFENHLATPWSKLTVKAHLRMVGTFVTLIAAQIIFDHEH